MAEYVTGYIKAYEASPDYPTFRANEPPIPGPIRANPKLHFFASILMPSYGRFVTQHYRGKAERRLAATALALRLYAADHGGSYPKTLDELVPKYLPAVPTDPFTTGSRPLKYSAADPAAPSVYSVGEDGADDGGSSAPVRSRQRASNLGRWDTKDAVLQMKASALVMSEEEEAKRKAAERDE
jgi:hypothetical protein